MNEIFVVLTDSFHKSNFKNHVEILAILVSVVDNNIITENIFSNENNNKNTVYNFIVQQNSLAFTHINKLQIDSFALSLFNKIYDINEFRGVVRDFLINLKSFSGNQEELFQEEKSKQIEETNRMDELKRQMIPGLAPQYKPEEQNKFLKMYGENNED